MRAGHNSVPGHSGECPQAKTHGQRAQGTCEKPHFQRQTSRSRGLPGRELRNRAFSWLRLSGQRQVPKGLRRTGFSDHSPATRQCPSNARGQQHKEQRGIEEQESSEKYRRKDLTHGSQGPCCCCTNESPNSREGTPRSIPCIYIRLHDILGTVRACHPQCKECKNVWVPVKTTFISLEGIHPGGTEARSTRSRQGPS